MVRNIFCQNALIRSRILALTTALSKESEISRTIRMATRTSACGSAVEPPGDQAGDGDPEGPAERLQNHEFPERVKDRAACAA